MCRRWSPMERGIAVQAHRLGRTNVADRAGKKVEACASSHLTTDEVQKMMERIHRDQVDVGNQDASSLHAENADRMDHVRAGSGNPKDQRVSRRHCRDHLLGCKEDHNHMDAGVVHPGREAYAVRQAHLDVSGPLQAQQLEVERAALWAWWRKRRWKRWPLWNRIPQKW